MYISKSGLCEIQNCSSRALHLNVLMQLKKQASRGVLRKRCSENMQQIYMRTAMPKCDFNNIFRTPFPRNTSGWLLLQLFSCQLDVLCVWSNSFLFRVYIFDAITLLTDNEVNFNKHGKHYSEAVIQMCF